MLAVFKRFRQSLLDEDLRLFTCSTFELPLCTVPLDRCRFTLERIDRPTLPGSQHMHLKNFYRFAIAIIRPFQKVSLLARPESRDWTREI